MACKYTVPLTTAWRTADGRCFASHGSAVILNPEGWILTAAHIIEQALALQKKQFEHRSYEQQRAAIEADATLTWKDKQRKNKALIGGTPDSVTNLGSLFGQQALELDPVHFVPGADLAIARLVGLRFPPDQEYPIIRNPTLGLQQGTSLCKLGFPLHGVSPTWNSAANQFDLPNGTFPMPFFPLEGIFTRKINVQMPNVPWPFPITLVETSSPGIPGHSGGPIFDANGHIWAIQSHTASYHLGLDVEVPGTKDHLGKAVKAHQFLNVGRGASATTILDSLNLWGVQCQISQ